MIDQWCLFTAYLNGQGIQGQLFRICIGVYTLYIYVYTKFLKCLQLYLFTAVNAPNKTVLHFEKNPLIFP